MKKTERLIDAYLEAVAEVEGRQAAVATMVEARGDDAIFVRRPHEQTGRIVTAGRLQLMTRYVREHLTRRAA